jgi:hypothetical protein
MKMESCNWPLPPQAPRSDSSQIAGYIFTTHCTRYYVVKYSDYGGLNVVHI